MISRKIAFKIIGEIISKINTNYSNSWPLSSTAEDT
jgi:hypothetical protein